MMPSWFQILIVVVLIVLLFGRGKISEFMGDVAKGIKSFKKGMAEDETSEANAAPRTIDHQPGDNAATPEGVHKTSSESTKAG